MKTQTAVVVCAAACSIVTGTLLAFLHAEAPAKVFQRRLTFADRVAYQRAIEEVYWQHRIWPATKAVTKSPLESVMSLAEIEKKVKDYLRESQTLEHYWQRPITPRQLQAEMDRMAQHTKQPKVLREIFQSLGDDPLVVAECLARPLLAHRLLTELNDLDHVKPTTVGWLKEPIAKQTAIYTLPAISSPSVGCIGDTWTPTSLTNAPDARPGHTAVWTGSEMIVWGGGYDLCPPDDCTVDFNTGARYNPGTDSWTATSTTNAPSARVSHMAVWTGSEMIVWGGFDLNGDRLNTGGRYNPGTDSWTATSTTNAPSGRAIHTAVWTGSEMIVWGGTNNVTDFNTGGRYTPGSDSWTATSTTDAPTGRVYHTAVRRGSEMIVWGGYNDSGLLHTGGRYNPGTDSWTAASTTNAPSARTGHTAVWTANEMIVWGGFNGSTPLNTGGRYCAPPPRIAPTPRPRPTPPPRS
jgi:hypothetical protein